jgi:hypothetical protein
LCKPYCTDLEEELRVVGQSLQQLEVSEEKALQREDDYQRSAKDDFLDRWHTVDDNDYWISIALVISHK